MHFIYTNFQLNNFHQSVVQNYVLIGGSYAGRHYLSMIGESLSEPHTNGTSTARVCYIIIYRTSKLKEVPGVQIRHVRWRGADRGCGCRHARRHRPADSHVHGTISLLANYLQFCYEHGYYRIFAEQR